MRGASTAVVLLCVCALAACGDEGVSVDADQNNVCGEIAEVACHNLYSCCSEGEIEDFLGVSEPRTEEQCREDLTRLCDRNTGSLQDSIEDGRVRFEDTRMNDCLSALVAPDGVCVDVVAELPWAMACMDSAWVGTVQIDGTCIFAHDCAGAPDNFCAPNQKCAAKPTAGFPCGTGCASDFYCMTGICQPRLAVGGPCTTTSQCQDDLFCDTTAMPMPLCTARQPGGEACTSNLACESGQCIPGTCMGTGTTCYTDMGCSSRCADDGSTCTTSAQCASGTCSVGGNLCSADTSCVAGGGDVCVFPVLCLPGDCIGDPVCTARTITVDYCDSAGVII
jgi:hypothetical protein